MQERPDTRPPSALEAQVAALYDLLLATTEAVISLNSDLGAVAHETGDSSFDDLRLQLFDVSSFLTDLALQLRHRWGPEAFSGATDVTDVAD